MSLSFEEGLQHNKHWAQRCNVEHPGLFAKLGKGQSPKILWIGCSDSRVPETTILGAQPGDIFVHRNIANVLHTADASSLAVIEYAVAHLKVQHVVLAGHSGCGGVKAALGQGSVGSVLDGWLMPIRRLRVTHKAELAGKSAEEQNKFVIEANVRQGVKALREMSVIDEAIDQRGLTVHGIVYNVGTGAIDVVQGCEEGKEDAECRHDIFKLQQGGH